MRFDNAFNEWYKNELEAYDNQHTLMIQRIHRAFHAHGEELNRLRKFEKKFRTIQKKCRDYEEKIGDYWSSDEDKSIEYEMKFEEKKEDFLYL